MREEFDVAVSLRRGTLSQRNELHLHHSKANFGINSVQIPRVRCRFFLNPVCPAWFQLGFPCKQVKVCPPQLASPEIAVLHCLGACPSMIVSCLIFFWHNVCTYTSNCVTAELVETQITW